VNRSASPYVRAGVGISRLLGSDVRSVSGSVIMKIDLTVIGACGHDQEDHAPYVVNRLDEAGVAVVEAKAAGCGACLNDLAEVTRIAGLIGECMAPQRQARRQVSGATPPWSP
jgi:hypothetical protein